MKHYRFIDWATQVYLLVVGLLILGFHGDAVPSWPWLLAAHGACMVLIQAVVACQARDRGGWAIGFLRAYYPILLYTGLYRETGLLNQMFVTGYLDAVFLRLDLILFGCQPSFEFMDILPWRWASELFYGCYFSYYFMITGVGLALLIRNRQHFDHYVSVLSFVFYLCYLNYILLPVMGPRIFFGDEAHPDLGQGHGASLAPDLVPDRPVTFPDAVQSGFFYRVVILIYRHFEAEGAAFPSSHVAIALVTVYFSWLYLPRIRWIHLMIAVGLCCSTVYCRYHYLVDVIAGALATALLVPLGNLLYRRFRLAGPNHPEISRAMDNAAGTRPQNDNPA
jgi:membrane-associated phospholipid phosphatase